ncbi:MAG: VanZ family protein [Chitinivibrionales bacterium]|nr:VanZ family protein [Chitinivibrionales bacterium]
MRPFSLINNQFIMLSFPLYLWFFFMVLATSIPGNKLPETTLINLDKLVHMMIYCVFAFLLFRFLYLKRSFPVRKAIIAVLIIGVGYAIIDELHQLFIPFRSCSVIDMIADFVGVGLGVPAALVFYLRRRVAL